MVDSRLDLRLWCLGCQWTATWDSGELLARFEAAGEPLDLAWTRSRLECRSCRSGEDLILTSARRAPPPPSEDPPVERPWTWAQEVAAVFHRARSEAKRSRNDASNRAALDKMLRAIRLRLDDEAAEREASRARQGRFPPLRLVWVNPRRGD